MHNYQQKQCIIFSNVLKSYKADFCCLCRGRWNTLEFRCKQLKYNPKFTFLEYINFSLIFKKYGFFRKKPWLSGEIVVKYKALKLLYADMAELADAHGSGPCESNFMEVQVLLAAPRQSKRHIACSFLCENQSALMLLRHIFSLQNGKLWHICSVKIDMLQ